MHLKILISVALYIFPIVLFGNMAKPYVDGTFTSSIFFVNDKYTVENEFIDIKIYQDKAEDSDKSLFAAYKITYNINSEENLSIPLTFIAIDLYEIKHIMVNGKKVITSELSDDKKLPPYIKNTDGSYTISFDNSFQHQVRLEDIAEFTSELKKGRNTIEVAYVGKLEYNVYGFTKDYRLEYAIFPSRYWKKFGPIHLKIELPNNLILDESNIGKAKESNNTYTWSINDLNMNHINLTFTHKRNLIQKFVLFISPLGFGILASIILGVIHFKLWNKYKRKYIFWIGIFIVPVIFCFVYLLSYPLIDLILDQKYSKHGYVILSLLFYPIYVVIYILTLGIARLFYDAYIKNKHSIN